MNRFMGSETPKNSPQPSALPRTRGVKLHLPVDLYGDVIQVFEREVDVPLGFTPQPQQSFIKGWDLPGPLIVYWHGYDEICKSELIVITPGVASRDTTEDEWLLQHPHWTVAVDPPLRPSNIQQHRDHADDDPEPD